MKKALMLVFIGLTVVNLYSCTMPGQEVSQWLRPLQVVVLLLWCFQKKQTPIQFAALSLALIIATINDHLFYRFGSGMLKTIVSLIVVKNFLFLFIIFQNYKYKPSKKLFRWVFNHVFVLLGICFLIGGFEFWVNYIIAIQSAFILLGISIQKKNCQFLDKYIWVIV